MALARKKIQQNVIPSSSGITEREDSMEHAVNRMFEDFWRPHFGFVTDLWSHRNGLPMPAIDVFEEKDAVVVKAELPGLGKNEIEVNLNGPMLTIRGEKKQEEEVEEKNYFRSERSHGMFSRTVELPLDVQADKAAATFRDGLLEVRLPKAAKAGARSTRVHIE